MTDKEVIIDGVDVSGCRQYMPRHMEDYDIDTLDYCKYHFKPCKDVDVKYCYFKQLKHKEQECEELKEKLRECRIGIKNISIENTEICKISEKYKQALDKIEKLIPKFDTSIGCSYGDYDCENCSDLDEDIVCTYKLKKVIKGIINKVKEKK